MATSPTAADGREPTRQLRLELPLAPPRLSRRDYVVTAGNETTLLLLDAWRASDEPFLAIAGPVGAGKSHLLAILAEAFRAPVIEAGALGRADETTPLIAIDQAEITTDSHELVRLLEATRRRGARAAIAGRGEPGDWAGGLVDLRTRLAAMPRIDAAEPDEALLRAVILKLLIDRQLRPPADLIEQAAARLPKTFKAAQIFVALLDEEAGSRGVDITAALGREIAANLSEEASAA